MIARPAWQADASCRSTNAELVELFFSDNVRDQARAKRICEFCPVRQACLDDALTTGQPAGVWGGMTELERRRILIRPTG